MGIVDGTPMLDLCYAEDSSADVDMNVVMTASGRYIEIQGTGESRAFSKEELTEMTTLAEEGIRSIISLQKQCFS